MATKSTTQRTAHKAKPTVVESPIDSAMKRYAASANELLRAYGVPTTQRFITSVIIGVVVYAVGVYGSFALVDLIIVGTMMLTGSAFLSFVLSFLSAFLLGWAAAYAGFKAYRCAVEFDMKRVTAAAHDVRVATAKRVSMVRGWFARGAQAEDVIAV